MNDEDRFEETHYDCIILGTSMVPCLLGAALSRAGRRVLHIDRQEAYGGSAGSVTLAEFDAFAARHNHAHDRGSIDAAPAGSGASADISADDIAAWRQAAVATAGAASASSATSTSGAASDASPAPASDDHCRLSFTPCPASEARADCFFDVRVSGGSGTAGFADSAAISSATATAAAIAAEPLLKRARAFSIDLSPQLLFSRGAFVDMLVRSAAAKYLEFRALDTTYVWLNGRFQKVRVFELMRHWFLICRLCFVHSF